MKILRLTPRSDFVLFVQFNNGQIGTFDVKPYLNLEAFEAVNVIAEFEQVINGGYFIEWPSGADLSADPVFAHLKKATAVS